MKAVSLTRPKFEPESGIAELPLSNGDTAILNGCDYLWALQFDWTTPLGRVTHVTPEGRHVALHRVLTGAGKGDTVRFKNGNPLDLRRSNLEIVEPNPVTPPPQFEPDSRTARIKTTDGRMILIDYCAYDWASQWQWFWDGSNVRARGAGNEALHHLLSGAEPGQRVAFVNGDKLDCRIANLKVKVTSGIRGVSWYRSGQQWQASFYIDGKNYHGGFYDCPLEAAAAYDRLAIQHLGDDAILNNVADLSPAMVERLELSKL